MFQKTKSFSYFLIKIFPFLFYLGCTLFADSKNYYYSNFFSGNMDEIYFGRISPSGFRYTVSGCSSQALCGQNLFDSNRSTEWVTDAGHEMEYVQIDFGSKRLFNGLRWEFGTKTNPVNEIFLQVQSKGEWKTLAELKNPAIYGTWEFIPTDASLVRIEFRKQEQPIQMKNLVLLLNDTILTGVPPRLTGYSMPIAGGMIPLDDYSLPGAPRKYRNGIHKGLDFNTYMSREMQELRLDFNTPIFSIGDGVVVRMDSDYIPMTLVEYNEITQYNQTHAVTYVERDFGGRQIWIDHRNGVMSSYNHLQTIGKNIRIGTRVAKGEQIGTAGNSGLIAEAKGNKEQIHLHLEIWIDGEFLGNDLKPAQTRKLLQYFFTE